MDAHAAADRLYRLECCACKFHVQFGLENRNLYSVAWFTLLLVGVILIFLDILLFRSFTNPVYRLLRTMQEFGKGNYEVKAEGRRNR